MRGEKSRAEMPVHYERMIDSTPSRRRPVLVCEEGGRLEERRPEDIGWSQVETARGGGTDLRWGPSDLVLLAHALRLGHSIFRNHGISSIASMAHDPVARFPALAKLDATDGCGERAAEEGR